ncbi:unnamed protein product [Vitrella brassicaformis CCMP3155]|uniref:Uncharacterized protein n=1 Tax=Vitrella brassicaformis (strain CCMP3155) TaxID=1169540 RepID=A0A0G4ELW1_VITBC|nr:unnamed protein product [Vitrella brassicaformis CCMP3155]|eukprot:CEL97823.1 unnamed protein product [Vitrella brassicaformis CCMP3155]
MLKSRTFTIAAMLVGNSQPSSAEVALRLLLSDPLFHQFTHLFIDEVLKRSAKTDLLLKVVKDIVHLWGSNPRVVLLSATIDEYNFSLYFDCAPIHYIPGRTYPITDYYLEDILEKTNHWFEGRYVHKEALLYLSSTQETELRQRHKRENGSPYPDSVLLQLIRRKQDSIPYNLIKDLVRHIHTTRPRDEAVLIFMPGACLQMISAMRLRNRLKFSPRTFGTSITISDTVHTIDSRFKKTIKYNHKTRVEELITCKISESCGRQRKRRAGRQQSGMC